MNTLDTLPAPPKSPLNIIELMETIFLNLDGHDLVRASLVCREWRNLVASFSRLPSFSFKFPMPCIQGQNPHFEDPSQVYKELESQLNYDVSAIHNLYNRGIESSEVTNSQKLPIICIRNGPYAGKPVLEAMREAEFGLVTVQHDDKDGTGEGYEIKVHDIRTSFRNVRRGDSGWPVGLRDIHCEICDGFHTAFRYKHLHPVMRFLEDANICTRGQGSRLRVDIRIIAELMAPKTCFEHYCVEILEFAKRLRDAAKAVEIGGFGNEFFTCPNTTKMVTPGYEVTEDERGLKLGGVVPFWVQYFQRYVLDQQKQLHQHLSKGLTRWLIKEPYLEVVYSGDRWEDHKARFHEIVEMFDEAVAAVNEIMSGIMFWEFIEPTTAQDAH